MKPNQALAKLAFFLGCLIVFAAPSQGQSNIRGLPDDAVILERRKLPPSVRANREIVLWMIKPSKNPNNYAPDDIYTCPDQSRGSYYSGPTRVSLVDSGTNS